MKLKARLLKQNLWFLFWILGTNTCVISCPRTVRKQKHKWFQGDLNILTEVYSRYWHIDSNVTPVSVVSLDWRLHEAGRRCWIALYLHWSVFCEYLLLDFATQTMQAMNFDELQLLHVACLVINTYWQICVIGYTSL